LALCAGAAPARAGDPERESFDAGDGAAADLPAAVGEAREDLRDELGDHGLLSVDESSGAVRFLAKLDGFLESAPSDEPAAAARDYLAEQAEAFGLEPGDVRALRLVDRERSDGTMTLEFGQTVEGIPIVDSALEAHLDDDGRLLAITGGLLPDPSLNTSDPRLSEADAQAAAASGVAGAGASGPGTLVGYVADDEARLAWRVLVSGSSTGQFDTLVDATTGEVVRRVNRVKFGSARVFESYPGFPGPRGTASLQDLGVYHTDGENRLIGPYAHAYVDPQDTISLPAGLGFPAPASELETPPSSSDDFDHAFSEWVPGGAEYGEDCSLSFLCSWDPKTAGSWQVNAEHAATQLFWHVNVFHDHLRDAPGIGFESLAFEGPDRMIAQAQDGAATDVSGPDAEHRNNANILVLPDGHSPLMQMYLWDPVGDDLPYGCDPDTPPTCRQQYPNYRPVDGADDPALVFHEYAHGLTNRLVTDVAGWGALNGPQAEAIDEGTADWYALDHLVERGDVPDGAEPDVVIAPYAVAGLTGLRTQPIDCPVGSASPACLAAPSAGPDGGYTYGDFGKVVGGVEEHADGEIWAQTLWQLRQALIAEYGPSEGLRRARRLVTDGLRSVPRDPSFLDMRNAILLADLKAGADGGDDSVIWEVFADRGMGYEATARDTDDVAPLEDFSEPPGAGAPGSMAGVVLDSVSGKGVQGATVAFSGHDTGLEGDDLATTTAADGSYRIDGVPSRTWAHVTVLRDGYERTVAEGVRVDAGKTALRNFTVRRNWALWLPGKPGFAAALATGNDYSVYGCGPTSGVDGTRRTVWSTDDNGAHDLVVTLPGAIELGQVRIDPSAGCGDPADSALGAYQVQTSADNQAWTTVSAGAFNAAHRGRLNTVPLGSTPEGVRYVKLRALGNQGVSAFTDVAELQVFAKAPDPPVVKPPAPPLPPPAGPAPAKLRVLNTRAKLTRRRTFVLKVAGPKAASVQSLFTVRIRRGAASRKLALARTGFTLSPSTGRRRVIVRVSRSALRRVRARRMSVAVVVRGGGQRAVARLVLQRPKKARRR
jgi:hypothetical protein